MSARENTSKQTAVEGTASEPPNLKAWKKAFEEQVAACKALLTSAEEIINVGVKQDMEKVAHGQSSNKRKQALRGH